MHNGWTGGQYSLYRILFGSYLIGVFVASLGPDPLVISVVVAGSTCCTAFVLGWHDRRAAVLIFALGAALSVLESDAPHAGRIFAGWLLFVHVMLPPAPYGSLSAAGRDDPRGGWYMSRPIHLGTWALMGLWYSFTGFSMLLSPGWLRGGAIDTYVYYRAARFTPWSSAPLSTWEPVAGAWLTWGVFVAHLLFAPLALFWRLRPWLWATFAALHLAGLILRGGYHFHAFQPLLLENCSYCLGSQSRRVAI